MDLRKALNILKYYGNQILIGNDEGAFGLEDMTELEDAIDKVRDFIVDMGGK